MGVGAGVGLRIGGGPAGRDEGKTLPAGGLLGGTDACELGELGAGERTVRYLSFKSRGLHTACAELKLKRKKNKMTRGV